MPLPFQKSSSTDPPAADNNERAIERPSPTPPRLRRLVKKGVKMRSRSRNGRKSLQISIAAVADASGIFLPCRMFVLAKDRLPSAMNSSQILPLHVSAGPAPSPQ